jgi:hypothetical protein
MAVVFVYSRAAGPVRWLPALVVPWSDRLGRIRRECGDDELNSVRPEPIRDIWGEVERKRPPILSKVEVQLIRSYRLSGNDWGSTIIGIETYAKPFECPLRHRSGFAPFL